MDLSHEIGWIKERLILARKKAEITFTDKNNNSDISVYEQDGNTYIEVECKTPGDAEDTREFLEDLPTETFTETGIRHPDIFNRYVYITAPDRTR